MIIRKLDMFEICTLSMKTAVVWTGVPLLVYRAGVFRAVRGWMLGNSSPYCRILPRQMLSRFFDLVFFEFIIKNPLVYAQSSGCLLKGIWKEGRSAPGYSYALISH